MAGFILLSLVLGVLISQPEIPLSMNLMLTRLNGESAFTLMSLLGASVMPHNFYVHSSIVQVLVISSLAMSLLEHKTTNVLLFPVNVYEQTRKDKRDDFCLQYLKIRISFWAVHLDQNFWDWIVHS